MAEAEVAAAEHLVAAQLLHLRRISRMCRRHRSIHAGPSPGDGENGSGDWRWAERDEMVLEDGKTTRREREREEISQGSTGLDCGLEV